MAPCFVWDPLFINILIKTRQYSHHLTPTSAHYDVTAYSVQDIDGFSLPAGYQREFWKLDTKMIIKMYKTIYKPGLPWASSKSIWFRGQCPHWAYINNIPRELWHEHLLHVGANLQVIASAGGAQVLYTCNLTGKAVREIKIFILLF